MPRRRRSGVTPVSVDPSATKRLGVPSRNSTQPRGQTRTHQSALASFSVLYLLSKESPRRQTTGMMTAKRQHCVLQPTRVERASVHAIGRTREIGETSPGIREHTRKRLTCPHVYHPLTCIQAKETCRARTQAYLRADIRAESPRCIQIPNVDLLGTASVPKHRMIEEAFIAFLEAT